MDGYGDDPGGEDWAGTPYSMNAADDRPMEISPGVWAGDFVNGEGLLGVSKAPLIAAAPPSERRLYGGAPGVGGGTSGAQAPTATFDPVQQARRAVNGVPLAIFQPQPSQTGAAGVGDVDALVRSLANLSPSMLARLSNANAAFISVPESMDQAVPSANLLQQHPQGWPAGADWGDVPGGYVDFSKDPDALPFLSPTDPRRVVVVGPSSGTSSYDVGDHETGHLWDDLNGSNGHAASRQPQFQAAYSAEYPNLLTQAESKSDSNPGDRTGYYYIQDRSGDIDLGAREAYAESFARYMAGDPSLQTDWPLLHTYWKALDQAQGLRSIANNGTR